MSSVITVENLSKKYIIGHQKQEGYATLRDVLTNGAKHFAHKLRHPFAAPESDPTHEEFWALKNVSFDIQQGDRVGIIGRNGAGKSTLLKILSRITEPTAGQIRIRGRVSSLLEVGTGFHPELTGRENIYLNGAILGMSKAEIKKKFDEIVAFAEVERFLDTPVKRYSSGMYVRLAFAVAAHLEPEILIVDEVLAVGDAQFQKKCIGKMQEVGEEGRTVLFVSHNMSVIQSLCTKAIWLSKGNLHSVGDVTEQITSYLKPGLKKSMITRDSVVKCGRNVEITHLEFSPNIVASKNDTDFIVELQSTRAAMITGLALLVYSAMGERVAILDLRQGDGGYSMDGSSPLLIKGTVKSLHLVEGIYSVGMYIDYGAFHDNLLELVELTIIGNPNKFGFATYPPSSRGVVELDFKFSRIGSK